MSLLFLSMIEHIFKMFKLDKMGLIDKNPYIPGLQSVKIPLIREKLNFKCIEFSKYGDKIVPMHRIACICCLYTKNWYFRNQAQNCIL